MEGLWLVSYAALWAILVLLVLLVLGLARELGAVHQRLGAPGALLSDAGLDIGSTAPDFKATEIPSGREVTFAAASGRDSLVVFLATNCGPCQELLPRLEAGWEEWQRRVGMYVVYEGRETEILAVVEETKTHIPLLADSLSRIRQGFGFPPTPYAFLVDGAGAVKLKGIVNTRDDIDQLIDGRARLPGGRAVVAASRPTAAGELGSSAEPEVTYGQMD